MLLAAAGSNFLANQFTSKVYDYFCLPHKTLRPKINQNSQCNSQDPQLARAESQKSLVALVPARERIKKAK